MISRKAAAAEVARMAGLIGFPPDVPAQLELVAAVESAESEDSAREAVSEWLESQRYSPTPADLRALVERIDGERRRRAAEAEPSCRICGGTGWRQVICLVERDDDGVQGFRELDDADLEPFVREHGPPDGRDVIEAVKPCRCRPTRRDSEPVSGKDRAAGAE